MKIYKVGGAVRDALLGIKPKEYDWVVTGARPEEMLKKGFKQVGKDFPVFLHPDSKEEYALARTEKKTGVGHKGFECFSDPSVTLEDDLQRRDLTINAIAESATGEMIDPFHGRKDIAAKLLRHVSDAFIEDPLRVLRVARFSARLPDFKVAPETMKLLSKMVNDGMLAQLTPERVWKELERALTEPSPEKFFDVLEGCGANDVLWPELRNQFSKLAQFSKFCNDAESRFAILFYKNDIATVKLFSEKWKVARKYQAIGNMVAFGSTDAEEAMKSAEALVHFLEKLDIRRRIYLVPKWLNVMGHMASTKKAVWFKDAIDLYLKVDEEAIVKSCDNVTEIRPALFEARKKILSQMFLK